MTEKKTLEELIQDYMSVKKYLVMLILPVL